MSTVTGLKLMRDGRLDVFVDDVHLCTIDPSLANELGLQEGHELDGDALQALQAQASFKRGLDDAYSFIAHRARSRHEVHARLRYKGHDDEVITQVLEFLARSQLVDDADFARRYVADKKNLNSWGSEKIRSGLREAGVPKEIIERVLGEGDQQAEREEALAVLRRKGGEKGRRDQTVKRRLYQTLLRRGFPSTVASWAIKAWSEEEPTEDAEQS
jgi:regulatory protein